LLQIRIRESHGEFHHDERRYDETTDHRERVLKTHD